MNDNRAPPMQVITPPTGQSAAPQATEVPTTPAVITGAQQSMLNPFKQVSYTNHIYAEMSDSAFAAITVAAKLVRIYTHPVSDFDFFYALADSFNYA